MKMSLSALTRNAVIYGDTDVYFIVDELAKIGIKCPAELSHSGHQVISRKKLIGSIPDVAADLRFMSFLSSPSMMAAIIKHNGEKFAAIVLFKKGDDITDFLWNTDCSFEGLRYGFPIRYLGRDEVDYTKYNLSRGNKYGLSFRPRKIGERWVKQIKMQNASYAYRQAMSFIHDINNPADDIIGIRQRMRGILSTGQFSDFIIKVNGGVRNVHRALLTVVGPFMDADAAHSGPGFPSFDLTDWQAHVVDLFLMTLYNGAIPYSLRKKSPTTLMQAIDICEYNLVNYSYDDWTEFERLVNFLKVPSLIHQAQFDSHAGAYEIARLADRPVTTMAIEIIAARIKARGLQLWKFEKIRSPNIMFWPAEIFIRLMTAIRKQTDCPVREVIDAWMQTGRTDGHAAAQEKWMSVNTVDKKILTKLYEQCIELMLPAELTAAEVEVLRAL